MMNKAGRKSRLSRHAVALALMAYSALAISQMPAMVPPEMVAAAKLNPVIVAGDSWIVDQTTHLQSLKIEPGAAVSAPAGRSLTMTVDGIEATLKPGKYRGDIVLTVTDPHTVKFTDILKHNFRQALFIDQSGIVPAKSVLAAAGPVQLKDGVLTGADVRSMGDNFNGIVVAGGHYTLKDIVLDLEGNGGNDFAGYGAGIMSDGKGTTLVLDGARISTHGAVRTAVIGSGGSKLIVKNSEISAKTGVLPVDYVSNVTPGEMKDAPWMLGIKGNVRTTNVLGDDTICTYINSTLSADGWGVLSVDASQNIKLTTINSRIELKGKSGYGSYAIGNSTNAFYGSLIKVPTHGIIITGGHAVFAASSKENVAALNSRLQLGLTPAELAGLQPAQTTVDSERYGVMMWGDSTVKIADGTVFNTGEAVFLNKGATAVIEVDGSKGARLNPRNGIIFQAIDNDDPGPVMVDGLMANVGVFRDPSGTPPAKVPGFDLAAIHPTDMVAKFRKIRLKGDFYNALRSRAIGGGMGPHGPSHEPPVISGANLVLDFAGSELTGVISAAVAKHLKPVIGAADYEALGRVSNTPAPALNNGVIVKLSDSRWTVTGTSYLSSLTIGPDAQLNAPAGKALTMTVDGVATPIRPGRYQGDIVLRPGPGEAVLGLDKHSKHDSQKDS
jgi:hypothetical protein